MKKVLVALSILLIAFVIVGCVDYKAYDVPKTKDAKSDASLVQEIAKVEQEVKATNKTNNKVTDNSTTLSAPLKNDTKPVLSTADNKNAKVENKVETKKAEVKDEKILPDLQNVKEEPVQKTAELSLDGNESVIRVKENEIVKLKVNVTDPDKDPVTFTFGKPLDKNGEWKTNYGDAGEYVATLSANDGKLTTLQKVKIVVQRVNMPPVISNLTDLHIKEGDLVKIDPKVADPNNDPITLKISTPLEDGKWQTDHTSAGEYVIKLKASDGELSTEKTLKLTVENVNVPPSIDNVPKEIHVKEGEKVTLKPKVTDLDGDDVKVSISNPVGDKGVWQTTYTDHGDYNVIVTADDGKDVSKKEVHVIVDDVNAPPIIKDIIVEKS